MQIQTNTNTAKGSGWLNVLHCFVWDSLSLPAHSVAFESLMKMSVGILNLFRGKDIATCRPTIRRTFNDFLSVITPRT